MTATPLPPLPTPKGKVYFEAEPYQPAWVSSSDAFDDDQMQSYATKARADLEAENANLRLELQSARDINLAVVNRQQAEIEALRKKLAQARKDEADAVRAADAVYEAQERAADAYRAGSSGY